MDNQPPHVVVLGGGFGGLSFVRALPAGIARITVVDRTNHHLFQPLLYQVATAGLSAPDIAEPIRAILSRRRDVTVLMDGVTAIDLEARRVQLRDEALSYDYLVIALGNRSSYFGHPEWARHAPGLKTIDDAIRIRRDVLLAFERAERTDDPAERESLLTIVVVGGGPTGVELAGTFAELQRRVLARDFRRAHIASGRVILVEAMDRILPPFPTSLAASARRQLESLGVQVIVGKPVVDVTPGEVKLDDRTIRAANILWSAGVTGIPLAETLATEKDRTNRIKVQPDLSVPGHPEVFAIGDFVTLADAHGTKVPGVAPAAMQMGRYAAARVAGRIRSDSSDEPRPFIYRDKGILATIGRSRAVARIGRLKLSGFPAWITWLTVHLIFLVGFDNKLTVLTQWMYSYLTYKRGARVIHGVNTDSTGGKPLNT